MVINKGVWWGGRRKEGKARRKRERRGGREKGGVGRDGSVKGNREEKVRRGDTTAMENEDKVQGKTTASSKDKEENDGEGKTLQRENGKGR